MELPLKGSLNGLSFISVLLDVNQSRLTGMIRTESGSTIKVVYLQQGNIAFASSNEKSDRLTEVLKRAGKLTPEQIEHAQARLKPNVSLGKTLVELGYINPKDLLWGARMQVEGILHQLLFWISGTYQVIEGPLPREIVSLNMPVVQIIYDGIMKTQDRNWVLEHIGSPQAVFSLSPDFHEKNAQYKLPPIEVVSRINGKRTLEDIAQSTNLDVFEVCKSVAALNILKLVTPAAAQPAMESAPPTIVLSEPVFPETEAKPEPRQEVSLGQVLQIPTVEELQRQPLTTTSFIEPEPAEPTVMITPAKEPEEVPELKPEIKEEQPTFLLHPTPEPEPAEPTVLINPPAEPTVPIHPPVEQAAPTLMIEPEEEDEEASAPTLFSEKPVFVEEEEDTENLRTADPAPVFEEEPEEEELAPPPAPTIRFDQAPQFRLEEQNVPMESMASSGRARKNHTMDRRWDWKKMAMLTAIVAVLALGFVYYSRYMGNTPSTSNYPEPKSQQPAPKEKPVAAKEPENVQPAPEPPKTATQRPEPSTSTPAPPKPAGPKVTEPPKTIATAPKLDPSSPLGLANAGKLPQAAAMWKKNLLSQKTQYTVQLEIACQASTVQEAFDLLNNSPEISVVPLNYKGQSCYRVLYGVYSSQSQAQAARTKLPSIFLNQQSPAQVIPISKALK